KGWLARGSVALVRGCSAFAGPRFHDLREFTEWAEKSPDAGGRSSESDRLIGFAATCLDRAVALAQDELDPRMSRWFAFGVYVRCLPRVVGNGDVWLADLKKIAELRPAEPQILAFATLMEASSELER